jgi:hypothetical protein
MKFQAGVSAPSGYAAAWDVFDPGKRLLVSGNCTLTSDGSLRIAVGAGDTTQAVYNTAYSYRPDLSTTNPWRAHPLSGTTLSGVWLSGGGSATINVPTSASSDYPMYFVGYVCTQRASEWKCGCTNSTCATPGWQLQGYTGSSGGNPSSTIVGITFDTSTKRREAPGSDNWPTTWAADDNLYASWGDGGGFGGTNTDGRSNLGYARITGDWNNYVGHNVWGGKNAENPTQHGGYSYAIIAIDGTLFSWVLPSKSATDKRTRLFKSTDNARTWTFMGIYDDDIDDRFTIRTFVNFGKDNANAMDGYVYINGRIGGDAYLVRVPKNQMGVASAYEVFSGFVGGNPTWSTNFNNARATYTGDVHWMHQIAYIKGLNKFVMINNTTITDQGGVPPETVSNIEWLEADKPWGPWRRITTLADWRPPGSDANNRYLFFFDIPTKWQSADGKDFTLIYTGTGANDSWNTIRGRFILQ